MNALAIPSRRDMVASASEDGTIKVWDLAEGNEVATLPQHLSPVKCLAFDSEDVLVSAGADGKVLLWSAPYAKPMRVIPVQDQGVAALAIAGDRVFTASLWAVACHGLGDGNEVWRHDELERPVAGIALIAGGTQVLVGTKGAGILRLDAATGEPAAAAPTHRSAVTALAATEQHVITVSRDGLLLVRDAATGKVLHHAAGASLRALAVADDGSEFIVARGPSSPFFGTMAELRPARLATHGEALAQLPAEESAVTAAAYRGGRIAVGYEDATIRVFEREGDDKEIALGEAAPDGSRAIAALAFDDSGRTLHALSADGMLRAWDLAEKKVARSTKDSRVDPDDVADFGYLAFAFRGDGGTVAAATTDDVLLWEAGTGKELLRYARHDPWVRALALSPDGRWGATADELGAVKVWDTRTGLDVIEFTLEEAGGDRVTALAFAPEGDGLIIGTHRSLVGRIELALPDIADIPRESLLERCLTTRVTRPHRLLGDYEPTDPTSSASRGIVGVAAVGNRIVSADQERVVLWSEGGPQILGRHVRKIKDLATGELEGVAVTVATDGVRCWDLETPGKESWRADVPFAFGRRSLAMAPDGRRLAAGDGAGSVLVLNSADGSVVATVPPKGRGVTAVAFTPDGRTLFVARERGSIQRVDAATGEITGILVEPEGYSGYQALAVTPDGDRVVGCRGRRIFVWSTRTGDATRVDKLPGSARAERLVLSPDARSVLVLDAEGIARLWSLESRRRLVRLDLAPAQDRIRAIAWTGGGNRILLGTECARVLEIGFERESRRVR